MAAVIYGLYTRYRDGVWGETWYLDVVTCEKAFDRAIKDRFTLRAAILRDDPLAVMVDWRRPKHYDHPIWMRFLDFWGFPWYDINRIREDDCVTQSVKADHSGERVTQSPHRDAA